MKILVIALHKLGDNLQVTPVFRALKASYPGARVSVLTEPKFRFAFDNNPFIDSVCLFDRTRYHKQAITSLEQGRCEQCPALAFLNAEGFDLIVNRQSSVEGAIIATLIGAREHRGVFMQPDNRVALPDPWTRLLFSACSNRYVNPFNFVDYGINVAGNGVGERRLELYADLAPGRAFLEKRGLSQGTFIALQPGSTSPMRRWPAAHFASLARRLLSALPDSRGLILGAPSEAPLAREITSALPELSGKRLLDLSNNLPLALLPGVLSRCSLLVTNDTGPMHVAAAVGCPVIALYFGESFVHETGPYGPNHHVIHAGLDCLPCTFNKPCQRGYACQQGIPAEAVAELALSVVSGRFPDEKLFSGTVVFKSDCRPGLEMRYRPLFRPPARPNIVLRALYYGLFRSHLHGTPFSPEEAALELSEDYRDAAGCVDGMNDLDISFITRFSETDAEAVTLRDRLRDGFMELRQRMR